MDPWAQRLDLVVRDRTPLRAARPVWIALLCVGLCACKGGEQTPAAEAPDVVCRGAARWTETALEKAHCSVVRTSGNQPTERKLCELKSDSRGPGYQILAVEDLNSHRVSHFADQQTYLGWLTYRAYCYMCHSDLGTGGDVTLGSGLYADSTKYGGPGPDSVGPGSATPPAGDAALRTWSSADLVNRFRATSRVTLAYFEARVKAGIPECGMPPWGTHPVLRSRLAEVFAYLRARANDHLPAPASTPESFLRLLPSAP
jgi:hypothetical protein